MSDGAPRQVTRVSAYAVCTDADDRLPRDAALRELTEETGLIGEIPTLLEVDSWHTVYTTLEGEEVDFHGFRVLYRCRVVGGELRDEVDGSTDACRFFTPSELQAEPVVDIAELAASRIGVA
ncbi:MAG: NUDIX domain-containing protein [Candidatus Limnocylindria bacterium]